MILVDLDVVSLDRHYQFSLDENRPVSELITEIRDILCQKQQCSLVGDEKRLMLSSVTQKKILTGHGTLAEQGVQGAEKLMLL